MGNLPVEEWHSLHQRLCGIARRRAKLDANEARWLRDAERIQLWRRLGYIHMGEYLERELGYKPHAGAERLRVARELGELPQIEAVLDDGALHYSAVRERGDRPGDPAEPALVNRVVRLELSPDVFALFRQAQSVREDRGRSQSRRPRRPRVGSGVSSSRQVLAARSRALDSRPQRDGAPAARPRVGHVRQASIHGLQIKPRHRGPFTP